MASMFALTSLQLPGALWIFLLGQPVVILLDLFALYPLATAFHTFSLPRPVGVPTRCL